MPGSLACSLNNGTVNLGFHYSQANIAVTVSMSGHSNHAHFRSAPVVRHLPEIASPALLSEAGSNIST